MRGSPKITTANTGAALGLRIAPVFPIVKSAPGSDIDIRGRNPVGTRPIQQSHKQKIRLDCTAMHILTLRWIRNWKRSQIAFPRPPLPLASVAPLLVGDTEELRGREKGGRRGEGIGGIWSHLAAPTGRIGGKMQWWKEYGLGRSVWPFMDRVHGPNSTGQMDWGWRRVPTPSVEMTTDKNPLGITYPNPYPRRKNMFAKKLIPITGIKFCPNPYPYGFRVPNEILIPTNINIKK
jgi:hypothetical protein